MWGCSPIPVESNGSMQKSLLPEKRVPTAKYRDAFPMKLPTSTAVELGRSEQARSQRRAASCCSSHPPVVGSNARQSRRLWYSQRVFQRLVSLSAGEQGSGDGDGEGIVESVSSGLIFL